MKRRLTSCDNLLHVRVACQTWWCLPHLPVPFPFKHNYMLHLREWHPPLTKYHVKLFQTFKKKTQHTLMLMWLYMPRKEFLKIKTNPEKKLLFLLKKGWFKKMNSKMAEWVSLTFHRSWWPHTKCGAFLPELTYEKITKITLSRKRLTVISSYQLVCVSYHKSFTPVWSRSKAISP